MLNKNSVVYKYFGCPPMTKQKALEIQARQVAWYSDQHENLAEAVKALTYADCLIDDVLYDLDMIDAHIPRGGAIESIIRRSRS